MAKHILAYINRLLMLSFVLCSSLMMAQPVSLNIDAAAKYDLSYADGTKTVSEKFPAGQDTVRLKWAWQRWKNEGMTLAVFRTRYVGCAAAKDIAWTQESPGNLKSGYQNTYTFGDWTNARGWWLCNANMEIPRGGMEGASSFWYAGQGGDQGQVATEFVMDDATWWPQAEGERRLFETPNADRADNSGYNESFRIERIKLTGPDKGSDGITRIGMFIRRGGECSYMNQIRSDQFSYGIVFNDGVPITFGTLTAFYNSMCGVCGLGTALGTFSGQTISGDSNKELHGTHAGYGAAAGGRWSVCLLKSEEDVTEGTTVRDQEAGHYDGQYSINIATVNFSNGSRAKPQAMFVVNPTLGDGQKQNSLLSVQGIGYGYSTLLKNLVTGSTWTSPGDFSAVEFSHYAKYDRLVTGIPEDVKKGSGAIPPMVTCTWTVGAWSSWSMCSGGVQSRTRSVASSVAGCTPPTTTPVGIETQPCTSPPAAASIINPASVLVVVNTADPSSAAMATAYMSAWGIPSGNKVSVNLGIADAVSTAATVNTARASINTAATAAHQYVVLAFSRPSRLATTGSQNADQSITSAITFGPRSVSALTVSALYGYSGTTPFKDKGVRPSIWLGSSAYVRKDANGSRPEGMMYGHAAKDQNGAPRGTARITQMQAMDPRVDFTLIDLRDAKFLTGVYSGEVGYGENPFNEMSAVLLTEKFPYMLYKYKAEPDVQRFNIQYQPVAPMTAFFGSMYKQRSIGTMPSAKGFFADNLTSTPGRFGDASNQQTPITVFLDMGAGASCGTVGEPYQDKSGNSPGSMVEQYPNIAQFVPLWKDQGLPAIIALWGTVKCPDRTLMAGDGLCAPYAK